MDADNGKPTREQDREALILAILDRQLRRGREEPVSFICGEGADGVPYCWRLPTQGG